jgi:transcriptional regulator with XRE-family HTH domain
MGSRKRSELAAEARRANVEQLAAVGRQLRASRKRRRLRQVDVARRAGLHQSSISRIELARGGSLSADTLQLVAMAVGRRLEIRLWNDPVPEPTDAGHLAIQELVLRLGRASGLGRTFELPTRPADPARSSDVGLRSERRRLLLLVECWSSIGDLGAAARSTDRKRAEAEALAVAVGPIGPDGVAQPYSVRTCWVVRATTRNRALVARYPEIFAARFPGSSAGWVRALTEGGEPPAGPGLVWCDVGATRLLARRRPRRP